MRSAEYCVGHSLMERLAENNGLSSVVLVRACFTQIIQITLISV
jgi:hypothetical protein